MRARACALDITPVRSVMSNVETGSDQEWPVFPVRNVFEQIATPTGHSTSSRAATLTITGTARALISIATSATVRFLGWTQNENTSREP